MSSKTRAEAVIRLFEYVTRLPPGHSPIEAHVWQYADAKGWGWSLRVAYDAGDDQPSRGGSTLVVNQIMTSFIEGENNWSSVLV